MKRKRSPELVNVEARKKSALNSSQDEKPKALLVECLQQYGLLRSIVSSLLPEDLLALALSSKAIHSAIVPRPCSLTNLLGKLESVDRHVETKPCIRCKVTTCDECRIHCLYQSIYEAPSDPDDLPNFSGHVLLDKDEVPILSPHHLVHELPPDSKPWADPSKSLDGPYHDQGFLDAPLEMDMPGTPESMKELLDLDLGQHSLVNFSGSSHFARPTAVLRALCMTTEARKVAICSSCYDGRAKNGPAAMAPPMTGLSWIPEMNDTSIKPCHCTMRSHFVDRWLCLRCYEVEKSTIGLCNNSEEFKWPGVGELCRCEEHKADHVICVWCWGEVKDYNYEH
ncbi:hypothetical protein IQ07DRAFT_500081 [Pyrenochaeta sp. DS3sAY3a]|nr:hypothetical protein IQ07DRAFT_500081 [Pyrenochaeta sp. DS3sAY3a]